jgi:hypothetical protein
MAARVYFLEPHQDDGALFMGQAAARITCWPAGTFTWCS